MKTVLNTLAAVVAMVLLAGCGKKAPVVDIKEWQQYSDPYFKVTFTYPKGWVVKTDGYKISIYETDNSDVMTKFFDRDPKKPDGVQILIAGDRVDTLQDLNRYAAAFEQDRKEEGYTLKPMVDRTVEGGPAKEISYSGIIDASTKTKYAAVRTMTWKDSSFYYVDFAGFNAMFEPYKLVYDSIVASLTLPKPKPKSKDPNADVIPSATMKVYKNEVLEVTIPENFDPFFPQVKGEVTYALQLKGYRQDCTIDLDIRPAKKLSLEKVVEQNSKKIANVSGKGGSATISGEKAQYFNYSPVKGIKSRIYFMVKNDKIYRIIFNYFGQMEKDFLPAFEKAVASLRIK